jgi:hypothetical protein
MKRLALAAIAVVGLTAPALAANCDKDYKEFWDKMSINQAAKQLSPAQYAQLSRTALRGYDACSAGDERFNVENFWKKLETVNPAKASDIFKDLEKNLPAKKK